jgi:hypothetical protein
MSGSKIMKTICMRLFIIISTFLTAQVMAFEFKVDWNEKYQKVVELSCNEDITLCREICEDEKSCEFREKACRNCIGSTIQMTYIFSEMGRSFINTGVEAKVDDILDLIQTKKFVTLTSRSIYNHVDRFNGMELQNQFRSLCSNEVKYPVVFFSKERNGRIGSVKYVSCGNQVFEMSQNSEVLVADFQ